MHPDKFSMDEELMADDARRTEMEENYKKVRALRCCTPSSGPLPHSESMGLALLSSVSCPLVT
jgi:hypothetical protein